MGHLSLSSRLLSTAGILALATATAQAGALPSHGHFVSGQGSIAKANQSLTVKQSSTTGIVNWNSFSVSRGDGVIFNNGHGATLNRVTGGNLSRIAGSLHATGSLYLMNGAGVIVSGTGHIVTGGSFVASSGDIAGDAFGTHKLKLSTGDGIVINRGAIKSGGNAVLNGRGAANEGSISASSIRLTASTGNVFDSGTVIASGAAHHGAAHILLISQSGKTRITGNLTAHGANGASLIETSGHRVSIGGHIDAGNGGMWLVDPENLTVDSTAATTIDNSLNAGTDVTLQTSATGASGPGTSSSGPGDIVIDAALSWNTSAKLSFNAYRGVEVGADINVIGDGSIAIKTRHDGLFLVDNGSAVTYTSSLGRLRIDGSTYKLVGTIAKLAADIAKHPSGHFALMADYDASVDGTYSTSPIETAFIGVFQGLGHSISNLTLNDSAEETGLGLFNTIGTGGSIWNMQLLNVSISGPDDRIGALAGTNNGTITNAVVSGTLTSSGSGSLGGLVGVNAGAVDQSQSSASVSATTYGQGVGSLVGYSVGSISTSSASGNVLVNAGFGGGLVGWSLGSISNAFATGTVQGGAESNDGGLVGYDAGAIDTSWASGAVTGGAAADVGGLAGRANGNITNSYATGAVVGGVGDTSGVGSGIGGLVGYFDYAEISASYATGSIIGAKGSNVGGLVGYDKGSTITDAHASGKVSDKKAGMLGGLVGYSGASAVIEDSYASGRVADLHGGTVSVGGLIGFEDDSSSITGSWATGDVVGGLDALVGGLAGQADESSISTSYATGSVTGKEGSIGGLIGYNEYGSQISQSYAKGRVRAGYNGHGEYYTNAGGLVGNNNGTVDASYATGNVIGYAGDIGGFVGYNNYGASVTNSYAKGNVTDGEYAGGFAGFNYGNLDYDYSIGSVADARSIGGFVGGSGGTVQDCYWDTTTSGITSANVTGTTGLTSAQLATGLPTGFDNSIWAEAPNINQGRPYLIALRSSY